MDLYSRAYQETFLRLMIFNFEKNDSKLGANHEIAKLANTPKYLGLQIWSEFMVDKK